MARDDMARDAFQSMAGESYIVRFVACIRRLFDIDIGILTPEHQFYLFNKDISGQCDDTLFREMALVRLSGALPESFLIRGVETDYLIAPIVGQETPGYGCFASRFFAALPEGEARRRKVAQISAEGLQTLRVMISELAHYISERWASWMPKKAALFGGMIGQSAAFSEVLKCAKAASMGDCPVLITGEPGTGKTHLARAIHLNSARREAPFMTLDCADGDAFRIESELFGHRRGAAPNALTDRPGCFDIAENGTFLLQHLEKLPQSTQIKLVRFLKTGVFYPLGDMTAHHADIRLLATSEPLQARVREGLFHRDLFDLFGVMPIEMVPLSHRRSDIPALCDYFIPRHCARLRQSSKKLSQEALACLMRYDWPGNIRELDNTLERLVLLSMRCDVLPVENLPDIIRKGSTPNASLHAFDVDRPLGEMLFDVERRILTDALAQNGGNRTKTAQMLKISRRTLIRKLQQFDVT